MIIKGKRVRNLERYLDFMPKGSDVLLGTRLVDQPDGVLLSIGFTDHLEIGESVLPPSDFGPTSRYNADGKYIVHRDQPMETAYRTVEWHWTEWRGRYDEEEMSRFVDVSYQRYPRTFVPPPSVELRILATTEGERIVVSPVVKYLDDKAIFLTHVVNLFLEIFGECEVFSMEKGQIMEAPVKKLNWSILPPGRMPWEQLREYVGPIVETAAGGNHGVIYHRLETVNSYQPDFLAVGQAGFHGYVVFGFVGENTYVLESIYTENATYVFGERWEELSKRTKAEILNEGLQKDRVIHREGWELRIQELLRP